MLQLTRFGSIVRSAVLIGIVSCLALTAVPAFADDEPATATIPTVYRDSLKITIDGRPDTTGTFTMVFKPYQGEPVKFTINVMAKQQPKKIREDIWKELSIAAGANYKVKKSGDKVVTIKKANKNSAAISLEVTEQRLSGMSVRISKN